MATALDLGSLPVAMTQDIRESPNTGFSVWYKYTATAADKVLGIWFGGADRPWASIWSWDYDIWYGDSKAGQPMQLGVTPGVTYYFEVGTEIDPPTSLVEISLIAAHDYDAPIGSIAI